MACSNNAGITACESTDTVVETLTSLVATTLESMFITTKQVVTTCQVTPGQVVTINSPVSPWYISPSTTAPPISSTNTLFSGVPPLCTTLTSTTSTLIAPTMTITELVIIFQGAGGGIVATSTLSVPVATYTLASQSSTASSTVIVGHGQEGGWEAWSDSQKGGLIAGCVVAFLIVVFFMLWWLGKRKHVWVASSWSDNNHPGFISGHQHYGHDTGHPAMRGGGLSRTKETASNEMGTLRPAFYQPPQSRH